MESTTCGNHDVLTVAVMLPFDEQERQAFYEHIAGKGVLHGARALSSAHGNVINYFNAHACLPDRPDLEACARIYHRLSEENAHQIASAVEQLKPQEPTRKHHFSALAASLSMFALGFLACLNFMPLSAPIV